MIRSVVGNGGIIFACASEVLNCEVVILITVIPYLQWEKERAPPRLWWWCKCGARATAKRDFDDNDFCCCNSGDDDDDA